MLSKSFTTLLLASTTALAACGGGGGGGGGDTPGTTPITITNLGSVNTSGISSGFASVIQQVSQDGLVDAKETVEVFEWVNANSNIDTAELAKYNVDINGSTYTLAQAWNMLKGYKALYYDGKEEFWTGLIDSGNYNDEDDTFIELKQLAQNDDPDFAEKIGKGKKTVEDFYNEKGIVEKPDNPPVVEEPVEPKPPVVEDPVEEPVEEPVEDTPVVEEPVEETPVEEEPVQEPVEEEPVEETPVEEEPVTVVDTKTTVNKTYSHLVKTYGDVYALKHVDLDIADGEYFVLLGPSGGGKTTLLRSIGGFIRPDSGTVQIKGKNVDNLPPDKRPTSMVFQGFALFPHMTVYENIGYGLKLRSVEKSIIHDRVIKMMDLVGLSGLSDRKPHELSGGQQQRVAIALVLLTQLALLIADEPTSALDVSVQAQILNLLKDLQDELNLTMLFISHDLHFIKNIADQVILIEEGKLTVYPGDYSYFEYKMHEEGRGDMTPGGQVDRPALKDFRPKQEAIASEPINKDNTKRYGPENISVKLNQQKGIYKVYYTFLIPYHFFGFDHYLTFVGV